MADYVVTATMTDGISDPANAAAAAMQSAADSADNMTAAVTRVGPSAQTLVNRYDDTTRSALALQRAQTLLAQATDSMNIAVAEGRATDDQRAAVLGTLQTKVAALRDATAATIPVTSAMAQGNNVAAAAATGSALAHAGFTRELVILGHEALTGNYSRIPGSMMVLAERTGSLNSIISTLGSLVLGWPGLFAAGAAAIGVMAYSANSAEKQLLDMQTALRATRDDYTSMATEALAAAKAVGSIPGFSAADTRTAAQTTAAASDFNGTQQQLAALLRVEGDLATVMGQTLPEAAKTMAAAMEDPGKEADDLAKTHFPGMTQALADTIKAQQAAGDTAGAFGQVLGVIKDQVTGAATASKTELTQALENLGKAFTDTGTSGQGMGKSISDAIKDAVADTINGLAAIVSAIEATRNSLSHSSLPGGPSNTFNPNAGAPSPTGAPLLGPTTAGGEQAVGLYQVMPSTGAALGYSQADLATTGGNIQAGIAVLLQKYFQSGGNIDQTLALYGGYGTDTTAAAGYIARVQGADPSSLDPGVLSAIQQATAAQHLPANLALLAERIPVVESSGRQFAASTPTNAYPASAYTADVNTGPQPSGTGVTNPTNQTIDQALAAADKANTVAGSSQAAASQITLYTKALADLSAQGDTSSESVVKISEALQKAQLEFANAIPAVQKLVDANNLQVAGENAVAAAWANGAGAAQDATDQTKAETQARTIAAPGTAAYTAAVVALTDAYIDQTKAQQSLAAAQQINGQGQQLDYLKAETDTLGEAADTRARELATMKEQQTIENSLSHATDAQKQTLLDNAAAIADATSNLQRQQAAWNEIGNVAGQVADQIGSSISNAFINGNGAAINFGNIARAALASVVTEALKLAVINPLMNSLFGTNAVTLGSVAAALGGSTTGGSGSSSGLGEILSLLSSGSSAIGLTGPGGLLSGVGSSLGISGSLASLAPALGVTALGFGAGALLGTSLADGVPQRQDQALAGAGIGAIAGTIIFPGIGTIAGGLLGGALGGLIGPGPENAYTSTGIGLSSGLLTQGKSVNQVDQSNESSTASDISTINTALQALSVTITSLGGISQVGQGSYDPSKALDLAAAFPDFRFASTNTDLNSAISGKSFASLTDLESLGTFLETTVPALVASVTNVGTLQPALDAVTAAFGPAIAQAQAYGTATDALTAAEAKATAAVNDNVTAQITALDQGFQSNYLSAAATISGNPADALTAQLYTFDASASQQEAALKAQLTGIYGDSYTSTAAYADQMAQLESSLGEQRLAIQQQYNDKLAASATSTVTSLTAYVQKLESSSASPLSPAAQYALASSQFQTDATAAAGGDYTSLTNLSGYADSFLSASRTVNGSGAQYAADFQTVLDAFTSAANTSPDVLTASVLQSEVRTQTQQLQDSLADLGDKLDSIKSQLAQGAATPPRITT